MKCFRGPTGNIKSLAERYEDHVEKSAGCWLWMGAINRRGYGLVSIGNHRVRQAHRAAYELFVGPIPEGRWVLHTCDVPRCVRPDHLFLGDALANAQDRDKKNRGRPSGFPSGENWGESNPWHKLTLRQVQHILANCIPGDINGLGIRAYAKKYGVSTSTIGNIMSGKRWARARQSVHEAP